MREVFKTSEFRKSIKLLMRAPEKKTLALDAVIWYLVRIQGKGVFVYVDENL